MPSDYLSLSEQALPFMVATNSTGRLAITQSFLDLLAFLGSRNRPNKTLHVLHLWKNAKINQWTISTSKAFLLHNIFWFLMFFTPQLTNCIFEVTIEGHVVEKAGSWPCCGPSQEFLIFVSLELEIWSKHLFGHHDRFGAAISEDLLLKEAYGDLRDRAYFQGYAR